MIVRASDSAHSQAVDGGTTVAYATKELVDHGNGESFKQPDHIEVVDRAEPVLEKGSEAQKLAILDVLRSAFPDLKVEIVEQATADDKGVAKRHVRILLE